MHIKVSKRRGLDLPIEGRPQGEVRSLAASPQIAFQIDALDSIRFKLLVKLGDHVKMGQPLLSDKDCSVRQFVSSAGGVLREIRRGPKRQLLSLVIDRSDSEEHHQHPLLDPEQASREQLIEHLCATGQFSQIRMRPFHILARPSEVPRSIFVKAVESAPFVPPTELQVAGHELDFQAGLKALVKLTTGVVHLVHAKGTPCAAFSDAEGVIRHTVEGPHPAGNHSVHIHFIDPILHATARVWTLDVHGVISIGKMLRTGQVHHERVIGIGGLGLSQERRGFFRVRNGHSIRALIGEDDAPLVRLISGDPLMGVQRQPDEFLDPEHFAFTALKPPVERKFLHFFRLGRGRYSTHRAYLSGHLRRERTYEMTTSLHGEERSFIDCAVYDRVMPMRIPTALLVKAILSGDYQRSEMLGLLEVAAEDFALPAFICPSKVEMVHIVREGLKRFAAEFLT